MDRSRSEVAFRGRTQWTPFQCWPGGLVVVDRCQKYSKSSECNFEDFSFVNKGTAEVTEEIRLSVLSVATASTW